jgi:hypothetical protein
VRRRAFEPRLELVAVGRAELRQQRRVVDDEQPLALAEAGARGAAHGRDEALERLARDRLGLVVPHHPPPAEQVLELHRRIVERANVARSATASSPGVSSIALCSLGSSCSSGSRSPR